MLCQDLGGHRRKGDADHDDASHDLSVGRIRGRFLFNTGVFDVFFWEYYIGSSILGDVDLIQEKADASAQDDPCGDPVCRIFAVCSDVTALAAACQRDYFCSEPHACAAGKNEADSTRERRRKRISF